MPHQLASKLAEMEPLYYWRRQWDRVLIRPDDLRAIAHRLSASIGQARNGQKGWKLYPWRDRFQAAGAGSVENQILELRGRHRTMVSLEMLIARTPNDMTLAEVMDAQRQEPIAPRGRNTYEGEAVPIAAELNFDRTQPGAVLEVWARGRLSGGSVVSFVAPHIDKTKRHAPQPEPIGIAALLGGAVVPDALLAADVLSPAVALILVFVLGSGCLYGAIRAMEWLFPPLELLPDEHSKTRWQKTWLAATTIGGAIIGVVAILSLALTFGR